MFENTKKALTVESLKEEVIAANALLVGLNDNEKDVKVASIIAAAAPSVQELNTSILCSRLAELSTLTDAENGLESMRENYLENRKVTRYAVKLNSESGELLVDDSQKMVNWFAIERAYQMHKSTSKDAKGNITPNKSVTIAADASYLCKLNAFIDNVAIAKVGEVGATFTSPMAVESKKKLGMVAHSLDALEKQLNMVVKAMFGESAPKMIRADVRYIQTAVAKASDCKITSASEKVFADAIVCAVIVRKAGKAYDFQSKAACHKTNDKKSK